MLMTKPESLEIVKVSTSPSGGGVDIPITNCRIYGDDECEEDTEPGIFSTIFEFHMLTKNEKTNFVIGELYVLVGNMLQAAAKTQKYWRGYVVKHIYVN